MNFFKTACIALFACMIMVSMSFGQTWKSPAAWAKGTIYKGDYKTNAGDSVYHGEYKGKKMRWRSKWWTDADEPGTLVDSGGTNPWVFINQLEEPFTFVSHESVSPGGSAVVKAAIYRDGAKGCYTLHHDDICAMSAEYVYKSHELANRYGIQIAWGAKVNECDPGWYEYMLDQLDHGHEITSHSFNHFSAAPQWQWFYHGDTIPTKEQDESIPNVEFGGLVVDSTFSGGTSFTSIMGQSFMMDQGAKKIKTNSVGWLDVQDHPDGGYNVQMIKMYCREPWTDADYYLNVDSAKAILDANVYAHFNGNKYFAKDKKVDFYIYPYDAFSNETHQYLDSHGHISARGGGKSGMVHRGDMFHPFYIDFDAYYMIGGDDNIVFPDNPHKLLSLEGMVDQILEKNGYMIRELHAVAPSENDYWGAVPTALYEKHMQRLQGLTEKNDITVITPSEGIRYRLTRNSVSNATISGSGDEYIVTVTASGCDAKYQDIISVIVGFPTGGTDYKTLGVTYENGSGNPRWPPRKLASHKWAVSVNPYVGPIKIIGDGTEISKVNGKFVERVRYAGFSNGMLNMYLNRGNYTVTLFNVNGKAVKTVKGVARTSRVSVDARGIAQGFYVMKVDHSLGTLKQRICIAE